MALQENTYEVGETARCRVFFSDPANSTRLTSKVAPGETALSVRTALLPGLVAGAQLAVGLGDEADFVVIQSTSTTAIVLAGPVLHPHLNGEPVALLEDPESVTYTVESPAKGVTHPAATRERFGVYHADVLVSLEGTWYYLGEGGSGVARGAFRGVPPRPV